MRAEPIEISSIYPVNGRAGTPVIIVTQSPTATAGAMGELTIKAGFTIHPICTDARLLQDQFSLNKCKGIIGYAFQRAPIASQSPTATKLERKGVLSTLYFVYFVMTQVCVLIGTVYSMRFKAIIFLS
jgi:hypothetical protein